MLHTRIARVSQVVYGDTDSVMIKFGTEDLGNAMALGHEAAEMVTKTVRQAPVEPCVWHSIPVASHLLSRARQPIHTRFSPGSSSAPSSSSLRSATTHTYS